MDVKNNWLNPSILDIAEMDTDLFPFFRGFLILGRFLGIVPISGVFRCSYQDLKCGIFSIAGLVSLSCVALLSFNVGLAFADWTYIRSTWASGIAQSLGGVMFASWGLFMYAYFLIRRKKFIKIFKAWTELNMTLRYTKPDKKLKYIIILISLVMFSSTILENAVLHMQYFVAFDHINGHNKFHGEEKNGNVSILLMYYWRANGHWAKFIGYHPALSVLAFINHKIILYGGNYMDVMMALFARAMYFKFDALNKVAKQILFSPKADFEKMDRQAWTQFAKDHESLCNILRKMNNFFSPIILVSYAVNIYYFCIQLHKALDRDISNKSLVHSIYSPWSFLHIIVRLLLVSLFLASVNESTNKTREILTRCPESLYGGSVGKLDRRLNTGPAIGFTGLNCFIVTRSFVLSIVNVVFMIELVLLQS